MNRLGFSTDRTIQEALERFKMLLEEKLDEIDGCLNGLIANKRKSDRKEIADFTRNVMKNLTEDFQSLNDRVQELDRSWERRKQ
jgi:hypothetical protein